MEEPHGRLASSHARCQLAMAWTSSAVVVDAARRTHIRVRGQQELEQFVADLGPDGRAQVAQESGIDQRASKEFLPHPLQQGVERDLDVVGPARSPHAQRRQIRGIALHGAVRCHGHIGASE